LQTYVFSDKRFGLNKVDVSSLSYRFYYLRLLHLKAGRMKDKKLWFNLLGLAIGTAIAIVTAENILLSIICWGIDLWNYCLV